MDASTVQQIVSLVKENKERLYKTSLTEKQRKLLFHTSTQFRTLSYYTQKYTERFNEILSIWKWFNYEKKLYFVKAMEIKGGDSDIFQKLFDLFDSVVEVEGYLAHGEDLIVRATRSNRDAILFERKRQLDYLAEE